MEDFSKYIIKKYKYWDLQLHHNQEYLGRMVAWCKRDDVLSLANISKEEQEELFVLLKDADTLLFKTFKPDLLNFAFLGNKTRHLHGHIVPRYSSNREFKGEMFEDKLWGQNYRTDPNFITNSEILDALKEVFLE